MSSTTNEADKRLRYEVARVTVYEVVERAMKNPSIEDIEEVFSYLCGALEISDEVTTRWRETLRSKRSA